MEPKELRDIVISALLLAFVFTYQGIDRLALSLTLLPVGIIAVSTSFVLHELGHRAMARKYKFHAEYQMWPQGLMMALLFALVTNGAFVFAAPGAVMIMPRADLWGRFTPMSKKSYGIISGTGPLVNIALSALFIISAVLLEPFSSVLLFGASVNAWLAVFNLIPLGPLDGAKVFRWDRRAWIALMICAATIFLILQL